MDFDVLIVLLLSILSLTLTSFLLYTIYRHRNRIPRHAVITALLWCTLPRIILLLIPFLMRNDLRKTVPFHMVDRRPWQQTTPLAKWCAAQGLMVNYLLAANAGFTSSFTLSLLHIVLRPHSAFSSPVPKIPRRLKPHHHLPLSIPIPPTVPLRTILSIIPLFFALPIPIFGLSLVLTVNLHEHQIIYFQGTYCNIDTTAFQFTCGILAGLPLIFSLVSLLFVAWKVNSVRKAVKRSGNKSFDNRSEDLGTVEKNASAQVHLTLPIPVPAVPSSPITATISISNSNAQSIAHLTAIASQPRNPMTSNIHLRLATRFVLLAFMITISAVLFLLQVSLSGEPLVKALDIDKYWEAVAPLIQFAIFAGQSAVLEVWFPRWFGNKATSGFDSTIPISTEGPLNIENGVLRVRRSYVQGNRTRIEAESVSELGSGLGSASSWSMNTSLGADVDDKEEGRLGNEPGGDDIGGVGRSPGLPHDNLRTPVSEACPSGHSTIPGWGMGIFSSVFDSDVGHVAEAGIEGSTGAVKDEEARRDQVNDARICGPVASTSSLRLPVNERIAPSSEGEDLGVEERGHIYERAFKRGFSLKNGKGKGRTIDPDGSELNMQANMHTVSNGMSSTIDTENMDSNLNTSDSVSGLSGQHTPHRSSTRKREKLRFDPPIPNFLKKGPARLPER